MNKQKNILELDKLQKLILDLLDFIYMPMRKSQLSRFINGVFSYDNRPKQIEFALIELIENGSIKEEKYYIASADYVSEHKSIVPTATQEGIVKYISSKSFIELMKHDLFFNVYAEDKVSFELYTKYLKMDFPGLVGNHRALDRMNQIQEKFEYGLSNQFYVEMNDFPTGQFLSSFLDDNDNRIIITSIVKKKDLVILKALLVPGKHRSYKKAHINLQKLQNYLPSYFPSKKVYINTMLLTMVCGNSKK